MTHHTRAITPCCRRRADHRPPRCFPRASSLRGLAPIALLLAALSAPATAHADTPRSYLDIVRAYADALLDKVTDTYGPKKSGLILSAFDRATMKPLATRPAPPYGARRGDRSGPPWEPLTGANPHLDQNLLRVLYTLTEITGEKRYAAAADHEIQWFFNNTQSPVTSLFPWGEHLSWEVMTDRAISGGDERMHEFARPWLLWDRCWELAPEPTRKFALGLWEHQIADHETGGFDRHAPYDEHGPVDGKDFARHAAFYVATWAHAYQHTHDDVFLTAIDVLVRRFEKKRNTPAGPVATMGPLDCQIASDLVPDPLASRLRDFARREDDLIIADFKRYLDGVGGPAGLKPTWQAGYSSGVLASSAMFFLERYEQVARPEYRDLLIAYADAYLGAVPPEDVDCWPMSWGHLISLELAAHRFTQDDKYLKEAQRFAAIAVRRFWEDSPLPRASFKTGHYESLTGGDSLALALLELHAVTHGLKTPIPRNTIDR